MVSAQTEEVQFRIHLRVWNLKDSIQHTVHCLNELSYFLLKSYYMFKRCLYLEMNDLFFFPQDSGKIYIKEADNFSCLSELAEHYKKHDLSAASRIRLTKHYADEEYE